MSKSADETVRIATKGEFQDFRALYEKYRGLVRGVLFRLSPYPLLDDLTQEAFMRIWRGLPNFSGTGSLKVWIYRIAHRTAVDGLRRRKSASELHDTAPSAVDPELSALERNSVQELLADFDLDHRSVLILFYMEELSLQEIAETLEIPVGTVKSRLHYGKRRLKEKLEAEGSWK